MKRRLIALLIGFGLAIAGVAFALTPGASADGASATYMAYDSVEGKWLPSVVDQNDYAGNFGYGISGVAIKLSGGYTVTYMVHQISGNRWLPAVTGYNTGDSSNGYAGNLGKDVIDGLAVKTNAPVQVTYRVHTAKGGWLPAVTGYNTNDSSNGYAGNLGQAIDGIQIWFANATSPVGNAPAGQAPLPSGSILSAAQSVVNMSIPYVWGGGHGAAPGPTYGVSEPGHPEYYAFDSTNKGLDCSGYVRYVYYLAFGIDIKYQGNFSSNTPSLDTAHWVRTSSPVAGDVVVYYSSSPSNSDHIAIYDGNGKVYEEHGHPDKSARHSNSVPAAGGGLNYVYYHYIGSTTPAVVATPPAPGALAGTTANSASQITMTYRSYDDVEQKWLPSVVDQSDYAGNFGNEMGGLQVTLSSGTITMRIHDSNGWSSEVTGNSAYLTTARPIDGVMITTNTGGTVTYQVHTTDGRWLPAVTGYDTNDSNNGYAGNLNSGEIIDGIRMSVSGGTAQVQPAPVPSTTAPAQPAQPAQPTTQAQPAQPTTSAPVQATSSAPAASSSGLVTDPANSSQVTMTYQTYDNVEQKWLPAVVDTSDYAGNYGDPVSGLRVTLSSGTVTIRLHYPSGWSEEASGKPGQWASLSSSQPIDGVMITTDTGQTVNYQVHITSGRWLPVVTGYNTNDADNGYAGNLNQGDVVDAISMYLSGNGNGGTAPVAQSTAPAPVQSSSAPAPVQSLAPVPPTTSAPATSSDAPSSPERSKGPNPTPTDQPSAPVTSSAPGSTITVGEPVPSSPAPAQSTGPVSVQPGPPQPSSPVSAPSTSDVIPWLTSDPSDSSSTAPVPPTTSAPATSSDAPSSPERSKGPNPTPTDQPSSSDPAPSSSAPVQPTTGAPTLTSPAAAEPPTSPIVVQSTSAPTQSSQAPVPSTTAPVSGSTGSSQSAGTPDDPFAGIGGTFGTPSSNAPLATGPTNSPASDPTNSPASDPTNSANPTGSNGSTDSPAGQSGSSDSSGNGSSQTGTSGATSGDQAVLPDTGSGSAGSSGSSAAGNPSDQSGTSDQSGMAGQPGATTGYPEGSPAGGSAGNGSYPDPSGLGSTLGSDGTDGSVPSDDPSDMSGFPDLSDPFSGMPGSDTSATSGSPASMPSSGSAPTVQSPASHGMSPVLAVVVMAMMGISGGVLLFFQLARLFGR